MTKRQTKEIILEKALKLFADKGYDGVTVRDIAAEVGIRQSSLYKHFSLLPKRPLCFSIPKNAFY